MAIVTVGAFVEALKSLESQPITRDRVLALCHDSDLDRQSMSPYVHWQDAFYTRNLIYRDDWFEVMAVCWGKGQKTPIHTHNGQLGWMIVLEGCAEVQNFNWAACNAAEGQHVSGIDCIAGASEIDLRKADVELCSRRGAINTVDKAKTIHRVSALGEERAVSLHIYSRPIESCVAFDTEVPRCYRRQLRYYSVHGDVVMTAEDVAACSQSSSARS